MFWDNFELWTFGSLTFELWGHWPLNFKLLGHWPLNFELLGHWPLNLRSTIVDPFWPRPFFEEYNCRPVLATPLLTTSNCRPLLATPLLTTSNCRPLLTTPPLTTSNCRPLLATPLLVMCPRLRSIELSGHWPLNFWVIDLWSSIVDPFWPRPLFEELNCRPLSLIHISEPTRPY